MQNDPELDPKILGTISSDFVKVAEQLKEASYQIRTRGFSDFPVFPVSDTQLPIGSPLYEKGMMENQFHYHASYMEEFLERQLIEKEEDFKSIYKPADEFCCLFIVKEEFTNFLFIPYPVD